MDTSRLKSNTSMFAAYSVLAFAIAGANRPAAAEDLPARLEKAVAVLNNFTDSSMQGMRAEEIANADCVAVFPGCYKGAAVAGVVFGTDLLLEMSFGRGFISCRDDDNWSAPGAVTMEGGSLSVQLGEPMDIVILSLDKQRRSELLSDPFTIGPDASAAWGSGKPAHGDPNAKILFFGHTKGAFTRFNLDGLMLKPDDAGNKALYGKSIKNSEIVAGGAATPAVAQPLVSKLTSLLRRGPAAP
jgi:lipid-binding SYLF domain-containing protein